MPSKPLPDILQGIRRRIRMLRILRGGGVWAATGIVLLLVLAFLDYLLNLPTSIRLMLMVGGLALLGWILIRRVIAPAVNRLSLEEVAGRLELAFPQFDDRLRSTVNFLSHQPPHESTVMRRHVIDETTRMAATVDLAAVIPSRPAWRALGIAAAALLVATGIVLLVGHYRPQLLGIAVSRFFTPLQARPWPRSVQIAWVGSVPERIPAGRSVDVRVRLARGDQPGRRAVIHYRHGDGAVQLEEMNRSSDGVYEVSLQGRTAGAAMTYWIEAGDDRTEPRTVEVVPPMTIQGVSVRVMPPAYVGETAAVVTDLSAGPAAAVVGSGVELKVRFNQSLGVADAQGVPSVQLIPAGDSATAALGDVPIQWLPAGDNADTAVGKFVADHSLRFQVRGVDQFGFTNSGLEQYELAVYADRLPSIVLDSPHHGGEWTADAAIPVRAVGADDYGLADAVLVIDRVGAEKDHWELPLMQDGKAVAQTSTDISSVAGGQQRYRMDRILSAGDLPGGGLNAGDVLEMRVRVHDNFLLPGPARNAEEIPAPGTSDRVVHRSVDSGIVRITLVSTEAMIDRMAGELRQLQQGVTAVRDAQQRAAVETDDLGKQLAGHAELTHADREALRRLRDQQQSVASAGRQLVQRLEAIRQKMRENHLEKQAGDLAAMTEAVRQLLNQAAEGSMPAASAGLDKAADQAAASTRDAAMKQARAQQDQAVEQLSAALDRLNAAGGLQQSMDAIARLIKDQKSLSDQLREVGQRNLGKSLDQMSPEDRAALEKVAQRQKELANQSRQALDKMDQAARQLKSAGNESADAMSKAAQTAQQQQIVPNQEQASRDAAENRQSQAQQAQQQAELGLQMILGQLQAAQQHKMEQLVRHLADLRKQVEYLVQRQARHNLDNLRLQGNPSADAAIHELMESLQREAGRSQGADADHTTREQLEASQALTERNTRDIAQSRGSDGGDADAAAAGQLIRAAERMAQAITSLNQGELAQAYDPSQTQALAALKASLKEIVQQQEKLQQELAARKRESIRQAYVGVRDDQAALNAQVVLLDRAPRRNDGQFNRIDRVRLNQMTSGQKKLFDRVETLGQDLAALDSIVYLWTNQQIAQGMREAGVELSKPETGRTVQLGQARIVTMLNDIINNLAIEPRKSDFEQRQAGGGGGGGAGGSQANQLPPESELRLLRALQQGVNDNTTTADQTTPRSTGQLAGIGERQEALRGLLDTLLQKASGGEVSLGKPANGAVLPEEKTGKSSADPLMQQLLGASDNPSDSDSQVDLLGARMSRSHQRLSVDHDPGRVTQEIQKNIIRDLDDLIQQSRRQMADQSSDSQSGDAQAQQQARPDGMEQGQPANQQADGQSSQSGTGGQTSGQASASGSGTGQSGSPSNQDIRQTMREWGGISPRTRAAIIDSAGETIIQKYRHRVEDYYRSLAAQEGE